MKSEGSKGKVLNHTKNRPNGGRFLSAWRASIHWLCQPASIAFDAGSASLSHHYEPVMMSGSGSLIDLPHWSPPHTHHLLVHG